MNAPTVTPEIQQEAARSLLERLGEKTALARFFRYNASAKHGVPIDMPTTWVQTRTQTSDTPPDTTPDTTPPPQVKPETPPAQTPIITTQQPASISVQLAPQAQAQPQGSNDYLKGVLITLAALGGIGVAGVGGYMLANKQPVAAQAPVQAQKTQEKESPLQYLEDLGEHLP